MPLSLSRNTRNFNSWAPSGGGIQGVFKKDVDPFESAVPSTRSYTPQKVVRKEPQAVALELNGLKPEAQQNRKQIETPKFQETRPSLTNGTAAVQKPPLRGRRGQKLHHFTDPNLPLRHVCADPFVEGGTALVLAHSPQSLAHLRKWNSQLYLDSVSTDSNQRHNEFLSSVQRNALQWNVSLPDIREAVKAERQRLRRPRRKEALLRTPSDVGRSLAFWVRHGEGEGYVESFDVLSPRHRNKYRHKLSLRNHFSTNSIYHNDSFGNDDIHTENLSTFTPQILAQELTLLDREMLLAIETAELVTLVMRPMAANEENCPNLNRLFHFYERMSSLVITEVLASGDASNRAQVLAQFVETADLCRTFNNRQSTSALMAGIRSVPIARLRQTWIRLRNEYPDHYSKYESLVTDMPSSSPEDDQYKMSSVSAFAEILGRIRGRPTVSRTKPRRRPWKEPPSLARWVEEQTTVPQSCDTCTSSGGHHPCCYLLVFVLGRNFFCPVRKIPPEGSQVDTVQQQQQKIANGDVRGHFVKSFDDPDALPFASRHIQCCALQPQSLPDVLRRAEISLRSSQASARVYDFAVNKSARHYLLNKPYSSGSENMQRSLQLEAKRTTRYGIS